MSTLRDAFLLDPTIIFLNHGSFGACPRPVFDEYQRWQRELERQPVKFLGRDVDALLNAARATVAAYVGAELDELIFVPNATIGLNTVIRSLPLREGDEILTTDHEYGALDKTWDFVAQKSGARVIRCALPAPLTTAQDCVEAFWAAVTPRTRVIFLSHLTSPTALILPVAEICRRARAQGIWSIVDGAHVPGHIPLDVGAIGADVYSGNFHKWLCAPKGAAFLHVRRALHPVVEPLVISWGWGAGNDFVTQNQWQGTRDVAAFLSVPSAIEFQRQNDWTAVYARCHALAAATREQVAACSGLAPLAVGDDWFGQMVSLPLPESDIEALKTALYEQYRIEIPILRWGGRVLARASFQAYNTASDADTLVYALKAWYGW